MTEPLTTLLLGGLVGYALKPDGRLEPIDYSKLAAMLDGSDKAFAKNVHIDTSVARATPQKYAIPGMMIFVDNPSTPTQPVYIRFNDPNGEEFTLTEFKKIRGPFGSFYIRNDAGAGTLDLIVTKGFQFEFNEAIGTMSTVVDHGACTGLTDDDHEIYLLADGTRQLTGDMSVAGGKTIDGVDISAHAALANAHHTKYTDAEVDAILAVHTAIVDAHHAQVHGAAQHTDVTRELFLPAGEGYIQAGVLRARDTYAVVRSALGDVEQPVEYFTMRVPDDFVSFVSVKAVWAEEVDPGNMYWQLEATYGAAGEVYDTHAEAPGLGVTASAGDKIINVQEPANPLTLVNLALGDYLGILFHRDGTNIADTLEDSYIHLFGLLFTYVGHQ